jgi:two-component system sensor histidine kinase YesM
MQVTGTNLSAATAITKDAMYFGERLFFMISVAAVIALLAIAVFLYRILSSKMVSPMLAETENMQMGLLKTQINAHFLVNTITCIESLSQQNENQKAATAAGNLAGMLKFLHEEDAEANIFDEMVNLNRYIEIMNIRHNNKFIIETDVDDVLVEYNILRQILQPLVENALTHGLGNKKDDCLLKITGRVKDDFIIFEITDNGIGMSPESVLALQERIDKTDKRDYDNYGLKGVSLINIQKRINTRYGRKYGLTVRGELGEGTEFTVRLPLIHDKN